METFLFLDTETTGFKKSGSLIQKGQGRVCQIAMILADETGRKLAEFQSLIKPNDWDLDGATENYYGLSYADCEEYGVPHEAFMEMYFRLGLRDGVQIVAHNSSFDQGMMEIETAYYHRRQNQSEIFQYHNPNWYCTMKKNTHISHNGKWPKLDATLKHYTGKDLIDAHDAMADTKACMEIFFAMRGVKLAA